MYKWLFNSADTVGCNSDVYHSSHAIPTFVSKKRVMSEWYIQRRTIFYHTLHPYVLIYSL